jgi:hypothetical protein
VLILKKQYEEEDFERDDDNAAATQTELLQGAHDAVSQEVIAQLVGRFRYSGTTMLRLFWHVTLAHENGFSFFLGRMSESDGGECV